MIVSLRFILLAVLASAIGASAVAQPVKTAELDRGWTKTTWDGEIWGSATRGQVTKYFSDQWTAKKAFAQRLTMSDKMTEYLGFKVDPATFLTCRGERVGIRDGTIAETQERCPDDSTLPLLYGYWTIRDVDSTAKKIVVAGSGGRKYDVYISAATMAGVWGVDTKKGDEVAIVAVGDASKSSFGAVAMMKAK